MQSGHPSRCSWTSSASVFVSSRSTYRSSLSEHSSHLIACDTETSCLWHLLHAAWPHDTRFHGVVIEGSLELLAGPVEAGHDGPDGHAMRLRCVLIGAAFDVDHEHYLAVLRGELADGVIYI